MVEFGSIYYTGSVLIGHLREHDNDIVYFCIQNCRILQIYTDLSLRE